MFAPRVLFFGAVLFAGIHESAGFSPAAGLPFSRRSPALSRVRCQSSPKEDAPAAQLQDGPKSVATGGTDYSKLPKMDSPALPFKLSSSIVGRGDLVGDLGFDPVGFATVSKTIFSLLHNTISGRQACLVLRERDI